MASIADVASLDPGSIFEMPLTPENWERASWHGCVLKRLDLKTGEAVMLKMLKATPRVVTDSGERANVWAVGMTLGVLLLMFLLVRL